MATNSLFHVSRDMPSFSVALTQSSSSGPLIEVLSMQDFGRALKRKLHLSFQPGDNDPLMKAVDTRFSGSFAYDVEYSDDKNGTHSTTPIASSSTSSSTPTEGGGYDTASSTPTTELDLNREFDREANTECGSDTATTLSDYDVGQLGDLNPPLHRQPTPLASLELAPPLPPRYRKFEAAATTTGSMRAHGHNPGSSSSTSQDDPSSPQRSESSSRRPPPGRLAGFNILLTILNVFRSLWCQLRKAGGVIFKEFTKDI